MKSGQIVPSHIDVIESNNSIQERNGISQELFKSFISYLDAKPQTVRTYTTAIRQFYKHLQDTNTYRPTRKDILAYRDYLSRDKKPTTVQNYITAVKLFFQWAEQEGLYPDIAKHVKGAKLNRKHKKDPLTPEQVKDILNNMQRESLTDKRDYAIFLLMVTGGLRDIEVHRANIEDIRPLGVHVVLYIQGKGQDEKEDYIKLEQPVQKAIKEYLQERGQNLSGQDPLFTSTSNNSRGKRLTTRSISGLIKKAMQEAGHDSERLTAHSLRHTAVTLSLLGGNTLQEAQEFARHSNISTTQIYAHNLDKLENSCSQTIANAIFN